MSFNTWSLRRRAGVVAAVVAVSFGASACGSAAAKDSEWPQTAVTFVNPSGPGGGLDQLFREAQPFLEKELGQPITVEYREGGQLAIGTTYMVQQGKDCSPFMIHSWPDVAFSYLTQNVPYTREDLVPVAGMTVEPVTIWVANGAPWGNLQEFIGEARKRPGEVRVSVPNLSGADNLAALALEDVANIDLNIVTYAGGGSASRNAVVAGEVEAAMGGVFASQIIKDEARPLAVFQDENRWSELLGDAPPAKEVVGTEIHPYGGILGYFVQADCATEHPERYARLVSAFESLATNPEYIAKLEAKNEASKLNYLTPDEFTKLIDSDMDRIKGLLKDQPEDFGK